MTRRQGRKSRSSKTSEKKSIFELEAEISSILDSEFDEMAESDDSIVERARNHGRLY